MKQNCIILIILLACIVGCKSDNKQAQIKGEIKGLTTDSLFLYGNDEFSDFVQTIHVTDGKFSFTMDLDTTLIQAMLFISSGKQYPVYLERGKTISIKGDINTPGSFEFKGNATSEEFTTLNRSLPHPINPNDTLILRMVEEYIHKHQKSLVNIYLLDTYFVQTDSPDLVKIKELIALMDGTLQDKPYIQRLTELIDQSEKAEVNKTIQSFTLTNSEGKAVSRSEFRDKYLLLTFWASWSDSSKVSNKELKEIYKKYPPKKKKATNTPNSRDKKEQELAIVGFSLDLDKESWKESIKQDTLKWEQLSDFSGWNSTVVKQYAINEIPYNILIDTRGKIIARGIKGEELNLKLDSLLKQNK